ncbi:MAG: hypothetical protein RL328_2561 [Acidobacteriota bacterium]|jgi:hypothetical protein
MLQVNSTAQFTHNVGMDNLSDLPLFGIGTVNFGTKT